MHVYRWVAASVGSAALTIVCVAHADHPVARLALALEPLRRLLWQVPTNIPMFSILAGAAITLTLFLRIAGKPWAPWMKVATTAGVASIMAGVLAKYALKPIFGRTGLSTFLRTGEDTFHWFHAGKYFLSFPSTHSAQAAAALAVLWIFWPRWRWAYIAVQLLLAFLLIAGEFHFPGDIIAGIYIGIVVGVATTSVWEAISHRWRVSEI